MCHVSGPTWCVMSLCVSPSSLWTHLDPLVVSLHFSAHRDPVVMLQLVSVQTVSVSAVDASVSQQNGRLADGRSSGTRADELSPVDTSQLLQSIHHAARELLQLRQAEVHRLQGRLH